MKRLLEKLPEYWEDLLGIVSVELVENHFTVIGAMGYLPEIVKVTQRVSEIVG